jgi:V-type H+-transporting ATPase 16kDa proteolipid subunit
MELMLTGNFFSLVIQLAAGLCCGLSCLAAGGTIGILGDAGVQAFGLKAGSGRYVWTSSTGGGTSSNKAAGGGDAKNGDAHAAAEEYAASNAANNADGANKLYVGMLIMLIFSEALALYGLIVALILSQHNYSCVV